MFRGSKLYERMAKQVRGWGRLKDDYHGPAIGVSYRGRGAQIEWKMMMAVEPKPRYGAHTIYFRIEW